MNNHHIFCCENGIVYGYGANDDNQLGIRIFTDFVNEPIKLNFNFKIVDIAMGEAHTLLLTDKKELYGCGRSMHGELGLGVSMKQYKLVKLLDNVRLIACGRGHSLVYTYDKKLYGFGHNLERQISLLKYDNFYEPQIMMENINIKKIWCGGNFSFVFDTDNNLYGYGKNDHMQLGKDLINGNKVSFDLFGNDEIKKIACGYDFSLILTNSVGLYVCGNNKNGEIGLIDKKPFGNYLQLLELPFDHSNIKDICCGRYYSAILTYDGNVYLNGNYGYGLKYELMKIISINTKFFVGGSRNIILFQNDNKIISASYKKEEIKINNKILMMNNKIISWTPEHHSNLDEKFKNGIFIFMMIYDRFKKSKCPIGKYVIFNIIKYVNEMN